MGLVPQPKRDGLGHPTSPLFIYSCSLWCGSGVPTNKFLNISSDYASMWFILLFISIFATRILELRWSGVGIEDWRRNDQFRVNGSTSAHLFVVFQGLLRVCLHVLIPASLPLQSIWRGWGLCIVLCVQMDISSHPSNHCDFPSPFSPPFYLIY